MKFAKYLFFLCFMPGASIFGMGVGSSASIPANDNVRIVFFGPSGAGKSTMINAIFNFAKKTKWNDPKLFPICTPFQPCTVPEYAHRGVENIAEKFGSKTQAPSEYVAKSDRYVVHLIDTPGAKDTGGLAKDFENSKKIEEFLKVTGSFHAICVVLPSTTNRSSVDSLYFVEQIKSSIPQSASNRIFLLVSQSTTASSDVIGFAKMAGLPANQVFAFNNFGMSEDGHIDLANIDITPEEEENFDDGPYSTCEAISPEKAAELAKKETAQKVKDTWLKANREFFKLYRAAKELGSYSTDIMAQIIDTKARIHEEILRGHNLVTILEKKEAELNAALVEFELAQLSFEKSLENMKPAEKAKAEAEKNKRDADKLESFKTIDVKVQVPISGRHNTVCLTCSTVCHEGCELDPAGTEAFAHLTNCACVDGEICRICKCSYTHHRHRMVKWEWTKKTVTHDTNEQIKKNALATYNQCAGVLSALQSDANTRSEVKDAKNSHVIEIERVLTSYRNRINQLKNDIANLYIALGNVSMSSANFHVSAYFNSLINAEKDYDKRVKMQREMRFYSELVDHMQNANSNVSTPN
jgi:GTP-binding protein EngB required for normal cell division